MFYRTINSLRFPLAVADVLELRHTLNHAIDGYTSPVDTPDYRQFESALNSAIESFGIDKPRHAKKLRMIITLFRDFHYAHIVASRNKEARLRHLQSKNREARVRSIRYGVLTFIASLLGAFIWVGLPQASWLIKASTAILAIISWDNFHSLSILDKEIVILRQELADHLRQRIKTVKWKPLIHKLALILGFKHVSGINVFLMNDSMDNTLSQSSLH